MNKKKRGVREKSYRALHLDDPEKKKGDGMSWC